MHLGRSDFIKKYANGTKPTGKMIHDLLPKIMDKITQNHGERTDLILAAWPQIIGKTHASMTKAVSFKEGILYVKANNSALLSILAFHEKQSLLNKLKKMFPSAGIRDISFRMGT